MGETIDLGCKVKDKVTGFTGTVTAINKTISGKCQCAVEAPLPTGEVADYWFDFDRLELVVE